MASQVLPVFKEVICSSVIYRCKNTPKRCLECNFFFAFFSFSPSAAFLFFSEKICPTAKLSTLIQRTRNFLFAANSTDAVEMCLVVSHSLFSAALSPACLQRRGGLAQAGGTLSVIRTTNGKISHERSLEVTPPLAPNRLL